jgi:TatD DNase family protein
MSNTEEGMKYVDAHVHLSDPEFKATVDTVVDDARKAGIVAMVSSSVDVATSLRNIELAAAYPRLVYAALGIHPWNVKALEEGEVVQTVDLISRYHQRGSVVAIGEIGLDSKYAKTDQEELMARQRAVFCEMLGLGEKLALPVIVHSRGTTPEIMDLLPSYRIERVLLHWFSNPIELLPKIVERGYSITEGPAVTFSDHIQEIVRQMPLANLLSETDGPVRFFKPPFRGKTAAPVDIPLVVRAIAEIKRKEETEVASEIYRNFTSFFGVNQTAHAC